MTNKTMVRQLTIQDEAERRIRRTQTECKHKFGSALPMFNFDQDEVLYFAVCKKCRYRTD